MTITTLTRKTALTGTGVLAAAAVDDADDDAEADVVEASSVAGVLATAEEASTPGEAEPSSPLSEVVPQAARARAASMPVPVRAVLRVRVVMVMDTSLLRVRS